MTMNSLVVGTYLKRARKKAGLTQTDLAKKSKLTTQYFSCVERGTAGFNAKIMQAYFENCGVSPKGYVDLMVKQHRDFYKKELGL